MYARFTCRFVAESFERAFLGALVVAAERRSSVAAAVSSRSRAPALDANSMGPGHLLCISASQLHSVPCPRLLFLRILTSARRSALSTRAPRNARSNDSATKRHVNRAYIYHVDWRIQ